MSDVRLRSPNDSVAATREAFGNERAVASPGGVFGLVWTVVFGDKGDWEFGDVPSGSTCEREERRMVLPNIRHLVSCKDFRYLIVASMYCALQSADCVKVLR